MSDSDKRLRYYNGQFLQEQDFTTEQEYHLDQQRRHNRQLHTYGIAEGLTVTAAVGATSATVAPGTAIDSEGRSILLTESRTLSFDSLTGSVLVVIAYKEQSSDPATVGDVGNTRWWEIPDVTVVAENSAPSDDVGIRLARLQIATNGTVSQLDPSVRTAAGKLSPGSLKAQNPLGTSAQFVQDQNGTQSPLAIGTGNVGIGTNDLACVFTIAGNVSAGPIAEARSQGDTASIQYVNKNGGFWHAGVGPANNFYFWNAPTNTTTLITTEGVVTAKGLKLSTQGTAADVTGDVSVAGKILVTGTVDGRDLSADGAKLDTLAGSTIEGVSNPGGNVDLVGQTGITVTGNNAAKTITIAGAAGSLTTQNPLGATNQFIRDQSGNQSPLSIGTGKNVGIGTNAPGSTLTVAGNLHAAPLVEINNQDNEASIRYMNVIDNVPWHVGTGGIGGSKNFFFWNQTNGLVATMAPDGTLSVNGGIKASTNNAGYALAIAGNSGTAPVTEMRSQGNEASIRYVNSDGVAWHVGSGGNGGAGNFFFWNSTNHLVGMLATDGTLTLSGGIKASTNNPGIALAIAGNSGSTPLVDIKNQGNEASIRYENSDGVPWQSGCGGGGGTGNFFFWNQTNGVVARIAPDGTLTMNGALKTSTNNPGFALAVAGNCGSTSLVDLKNQGNEASIRYENSDGVPWQSGCGGGGGTGNFFFWNQPNGIVATITPDGTLNLKGNLVVGGGLSMRRAMVTGSFGQADPDGTIRMIDVGFQPKFISLEGRAHAWFGKAGAYFSYGGAIGGFCQVSDDGRVFHVAGHGPCITRSPTIPYFGIYNEVGSSNPDKAFGCVSFLDFTTTPNLHVHLEILVDSITSTGFRLKLSRTFNAGCIAPDVFGLDMIFAVMG